MILTPTPIDGVFLAETTVRADERGDFTRLYCERDLGACMKSRRIVQVNRSRTTRPGAIRGLHFQRPPHAETKIIRCLKGRVWDVAVDLRANSRTFMRWHATELSPETATAIVIPEGCAHGFQALERDSELLYLHTAFYEPASDAGVPFNDLRLSIDWPLDVTDVSPRDRSYAPLENGFRGLTV